MNASRSPGASEPTPQASANPAVNGGWSNTRQGERRGNVKLHALFDLETGTIRDVEATPGTQHESPILASLLDDIDDLEAFVADPGYLSRRNLRLVADRGGTPYIKPKKSSTLKTKGCWQWKDMVGLFREHPRIFHRVYRLRPRMEAWWHSLKRLVGDLVRSRTIQTIKTEIWAKIVYYNLIWTIRRSYGF